MTEDVGLRLEAVGVEHLGRAKKITVTKDDTVILDGAGDRHAIEERCQQVGGRELRSPFVDSHLIPICRFVDKSHLGVIFRLTTNLRDPHPQIQEAISVSTSDYDKEKLQERHGKLSGGVAVIKVGGASEVEVGERKDRVTDALNATKAAVEEGIVPGGGTALLYASKRLAALKEGMASADQRTGVDIIARALRKPCQRIVDNAGGDGAAVVGKLLDQPDETLGYDASSGTYG